MKQANRLITYIAVSFSLFLVCLLTISLDVMRYNQASATEFSVPASWSSYLPFILNGSDLMPTPTPFPTYIEMNIIRPSLEELVGDDLLVVVTASSVYELQGITAQVESRQTTLMFSQYCDHYCYPAWIGTLSLIDLERGYKLLTVTATDVFSNSTQLLRSFIYDQKPNLTVSAPLNDTVARPQVYLQATCTDDDPLGCESITVDVNGTVIISGQVSISETVSLAAYDGRNITLQFIAQDSAGQTSLEERTIYVESSTKLVEIETVQGYIWDVQSDRILFREQTSDMLTLKILDRASKQETTIMSEAGKKPQYGYLTPTGAIFVEQSGDVLTNILYEWKDGVLLSLGSLNGSTSLVVADNFAIWNTGTTLILRNLATGINTTVSVDAGNTQNDVAANGDVVYWGTAYQVFRYRLGLVTQVTSDANLWNTYPRTDGTNIVYRKHSPCCDNQVYQIAFYGSSGEIILTSPRSLEPMPGRDYQVNNGWAAFTELGTGGQTQVWTLSPSGQLTQVSYFGTSSSIDALGPNGEIVFLNTRRYLSTPPYGNQPMLVGSMFGRSFWQNGDLFLAIGRSLFQVVP